MLTVDGGQGYALTMALSSTRYLSSSWKHIQKWKRDIHTGQGTTNSITNTFTVRVIPRLVRGKWQISALNTPVCLLSASCAALRKLLDARPTRLVWNPIVSYFSMGAGFIFEKACCRSPSHMPCSDCWGQLRVAYIYSASLLSCTLTRSSKFYFYLLL